MDMRFAIGIDPDTTATAIAIAEVKSRQVVAVYVVRQKGKKDRQATLAMVEHFAEIFDDRDSKLPPGDLVDVIAVEGQELYLNHNKKGDKKSKGTQNPRSILWLAPISGAGLMMLRLVSRSAELLFPAPGGWKGQTPKQVHHGRIGSKVGWEMVNVGSKETGYAYPANPTVMKPDCLEAINQADWKHVMDAVGLCFYGIDHLEKKAKMAAAAKSKK